MRIVMKKQPWFLCLLLLVVAILPFSLFSGLTRNVCAASSQTPPTKESCITTDCHERIRTEKYVHGPIASGDCVICHKQRRKHSFEKIENPGKLCAECHERLDTRKYVHAPVKEGKCSACHDPHQSPNKYQLRAAGAELCFKCHDRSIMKGKFVHGPAAVGSCTTCHAIHQSDFPKLLRTTANDVCFECHADKAEAIKNSKFTHAPVKKSCME